MQQSGPPLAAVGQTILNIRLWLRLLTNKSRSGLLEQQSTGQRVHDHGEADERSLSRRTSGFQSRVVVAGFIRQVINDLVVTHRTRFELAHCQTDAARPLACISSNSTGASFPVTSSRTCWRRRQLPRNKLATIITRKLATSPDYLDMSRLSESRQLPRNFLVTSWRHARLPRNLSLIHI